MCSTPAVARARDHRGTAERRAHGGEDTAEQLVIDMTGPEDPFDRAPHVLNVRPIGNEFARSEIRERHDISTSKHHCGVTLCDGMALQKRFV